MKMPRWFRKKRLVPLDGGLNAALRKKDRDLYEELCRLTPGTFWRQWKRVHPEDFPLDGMSPVNASSVIFP